MATLLLRDLSQSTVLEQWPECRVYQKSIPGHIDRVCINPFHQPIPIDAFMRVGHVPYRPNALRRPFHCYYGGIGLAHDSILHHKKAVFCGRKLATISTTKLRVTCVILPMESLPVRHFEHAKLFWMQCVIDTFLLQRVSSATSRTQLCCILTRQCRLWNTISVPK